MRYALLVCALVLGGCSTLAAQNLAVARGERVVLDSIDVANLDTATAAARTRTDAAEDTAESSNGTAGYQAWHDSFGK